MSIFTIKKQIYKTAEWMSDEESRQNFINEWRYLVNMKLVTMMPPIIRRFFYKKALPLNPFKESTFDSSVRYPVFQVQTKDALDATLLGFNLFLRQEYRYKDAVKIENNDIFLDIGACIGDTSMWASFNGCKHAYAFEPFEDAIEYTRKNLIANQIENTTIVPLGCSDKKGVLSFGCPPDKAIYCAKIADDGDMKIEVTDLDSWCEENNVIPTFIKMDIEGAEINALKGAEKIITTYKPKLAICIYHKPEIDMIEIPRMLKEYVPEYKFYCKKSGQNAETVLFATI